MDLDWINQEKEFDTGLELPEGFDIADFITPSNILNQA